jgi:hypothetical protein
MLSSNFSSHPSVVELRAVRDQNQYRWKKMGTPLTASMPPVPIFMPTKTSELLRLKVHFWFYRL